MKHRQFLAVQPIQAFAESPSQLEGSAVGARTRSRLVVRSLVWRAMATGSVGNRTGAATATRSWSPDRNARPAHANPHDYFPPCSLAAQVNSRQQGMVAATRDDAQATAVRQPAKRLPEHGSALGRPVALGVQTEDTFL